MFNFSRVNLLKATEIPCQPALCIDIGAPTYVIGKKQLDAALLT